LQPLTNWTEFLAAAAPLRPALHQYCARLLGSVMDAEDVVQDTLIKAFTSQSAPQESSLMRPWLFTIAHNRAIDLLRAQAIRISQSLDDINESSMATLFESGFVTQDYDPLQQLIQQETLTLSIATFLHLPIAQRSVVILKDVLAESLLDIASLLGLSVDAVKGHLARGRRELALRRHMQADPLPPSAPSSNIAQYVALFNQRNWEGLKQLLSSEVILKQSSHPIRHGAKDVGAFFTIYASCDFGILKAARLDNREVILVYPPEGRVPQCLMWLEWQNDSICFIRDYRYVDYLLAELPLIDLQVL
jgi:RNA polymerase sigma factor (sigma-70 family)